MAIIALQAFGKSVPCNLPFYRAWDLPVSVDELCRTKSTKPVGTTKAREKLRRLR